MPSDTPKLTFAEYQIESRIFAKYPELGRNLTYPALGLSGETGEVSEIVKKMVRDDRGLLSPEKREKLRRELGDVLWYVAAVASEAMLDLDDIAWENLRKLQDRLDRGVIGGSGDNR